jgi:ribonuclease D
MRAIKIVWRRLLRILKITRPQPHGRNALWPTSEQIEQLPWFEGLPLEHIITVESEAGAQRAYDEIVRETLVGFDTESKPTFKRGEVSHGPHVAQFSTMKRAYVISLHHVGVRKIVGALMELPTLKKVGFGLGDDLKRIRKKLNVQPQAVLDVETMFAKRGLGRHVGVKVAVALVFKQRFRKSKRAATSNWADRHLSDQQILYAANDAYAALRVCVALEAQKTK